MERFLKVIAIAAGVLALSFVGFLIWAYTPIPTFKPAVYKPAAVGLWPTQTQAPENIRT